MAKLKKTLQRHQTWEKPVSCLPSRADRYASLSNKSFRRLLEEHAVDQESTKTLREARKQRLEHLREKFDAKFAEEPYEAFFGKRFEPFWSRLMPDFLKQEMVWQTPVQTETTSDAAAEYLASKSRRGLFSQSKSFQMRSSQQSGSRPNISAWSSSWDSETNETRRSYYDPISGRMVDEGARSLDPSRQDDIDTLTPSDVRASMGTAEKLPHQDLAARAQQLATLEEDYKNKSSDSEHEELVEARKTLETLRAQVQILERKAHSTLTREEDVQDAERPEVFENGWNEAPQGMQTAFETEQWTCGHGDKKSLEQEMNALNTAQVEESNDGYEPTPTGLQTQYEQEYSGDGSKPSLEQEMAALNKKPAAANDGYSTAPIGMQTAYKKEEAGSLEQELNDRNKFKEYDDGYSTTPVGMQTAYEKEDVGSLEQELNDRLKHKEYNDGYPTARTGMQSLYEQEDAGALEQELNEKLKGKEYDDGYSAAPSGMQTLYENEDAGTLEEELNDRVKPHQHDDGYSTALSGMQTLYEKEKGGVLEKEINDQLKRKEHDDGHSTVPKGLQSTFEQEQEQVKHGSAKSLEQELQDGLQAKAYDDGYSASPSGLQTAFNTEKQQTSAGKRESLEQEMGSILDAPPSDGGYATAPIGLQVLFRQEQQDAEDHQRKSLEDELNVKNCMQDHEDDYSRTPMGMESSFRKEEQLKAMQGEGDMCTNVGKFGTSRHWYKQSASNNLSEDTQKAHQRASDRDLVREVRSAYENHYGPITTEHQQPQLAAETERRVDDTVHKALDEHDRGEGEKAYEFKGDNLERGLVGKQIPADKTSSNASAAQASPSATALPPRMKWAEPAIYKVIAYDVHKEAISITTTPSNFSNSDSPISISSALSRLHQPARFIPHFAELQKGGYQVINASRDWLVLRKVDRGEKRCSTMTEDFVNPIDPKMMARRVPYEEPPAGRFASPTGFVNLDPIFPPEPRQPAPGETVTVEIPVHGGPDVESYRHGRIRREEPVFSGSKRWREPRRGGSERREKRRLRDRITWALSVGAGTAVCMYAVGVAGELAKSEEKRGKRE